MSGSRRIAAWITDNAAVVLVAALLLTVVLGAGLPHLEEDGDGMPGFGVTVAIATLLSIALLWSRN
ncbi:PGF-CTERM sorting domain-containing protein [Haloterrigena salifodinae]|uniref:PGF-CTERM sorting domain-containing protein n=1 Tax=Haloterrigena salifodinae TaxID=2675099 RepID=UPI000F892B09|nr:PGF-CTERM sorting domain-containing protein [Haloterrigena salifodinae]